MNYQFSQSRQAGEWIRSLFKTQNQLKFVATEFKAAELGQIAVDGMNFTIG